MEMKLEDAGFRGRRRRLCIFFDELSVLFASQELSAPWSSSVDGRRFSYEPYRIPQPLLVEKVVGRPDNCHFAYDGAG